MLRFDPEQIILMPVSGSKRAKQIEMRVALHNIRVPKDIILATPEQVAQQRNIVGTIIRPALQEKSSISYE